MRETIRSAPWRRASSPLGAAGLLPLRAHLRSSFGAAIEDLPAAVSQPDGIPPILKSRFTHGIEVLKAHVARHSGA